MAIKKIPVQDVKVGDIVWNQGYKWDVQENVYDAVGNMRDTPRHILVCVAVPGQNCPAGYAEHMTLGYLVGTQAELEVPDPAGNTD